MTGTIPDHYDVLGVAPDAAPGEIDEAYRHLALLYAPDRAGASERFQQVRAAYDVLSDSQLRALYDIRREALYGPSMRAAPRPLAEGDAGVSPKPWGLPAIAAVIAIPLGMWLVGLVYVLRNGSPGDLSDADIIFNTIFSIVVLDGIFVIGPVLFCLRRYRMGWRGLGLRAFARAHWWLPFVAAATALVATIAYNAVLYGFGLSPEQDIDQLFNSRIVLPLTFVAVVIVAPLAEEIFFRGFVFGGLIRPLGVVGAMIASGVLFATFHVQDGNSALLVPLFACIGAGLAWIYYRTGSLWPSIGTHFIFNLVGFTVSAISSWTS